MKPNDWGTYFKIWGRNRQLDSRENARFEKYCEDCKKLWDYYGPYNQEIWRGTLSKLMDV